MSARDDLDAALGDLARGKMPDEADRRLITRTLQTFLSKPSRARDGLLRQEALRQRDKLLAELAREYCGDLRAIRPQVRRISQWALRYETSGWHHDRHATTCPPHQIGKPEGIIWAILKTWPKMPGERQLHEILTNSGA